MIETKRDLPTTRRSYYRSNPSYRLNKKNIIKSKNNIKCNRIVRLHRSQHDPIKYVLDYIASKYEISNVMNITILQYAIRERDFKHMKMLINFQKKI